MRSLPVLALGAALCLSGCAAHRVETASAAPKAGPAKAPARPGPTDKPQAAAHAAAAPEAGSPESSALAAVPAETAPPKAPEALAPPATESSYVYAPQQAAVANHPAPAVPAGSTKPPAGAPQEGARTGDSAEAADEAPDDGPGHIQLSVVASVAEIATGAIMTVDVMAASNRAVVDAPLHLTFDPNVVEFVDGTVGDFLAQGGSSVVFFADGRSRPGDVAVAAGRVERAQGAKGSGLLCRVRFRGTAAGTTPVAVGRAKAWGVNGEELTVSSAGANVVVH